MALEHVAWIGGGTGSGKTTVARLLAARHGLRAFHVDAFWYAYDARLREPELTPDAQWLGQTPEAQAAEFEATSRRRLRLVFEDLADLPERPPILVEGPQVLPDALPGGAAAVFLVPTAEFQRALLEPRPLPPTADPPRALAHRIEKDRLYAQRVAALAREHGFPLVEVDGSRPPEEIADEAERLLAPVLARAAEPVDLRPVRRWSNQAVAANLRSWLASAQAPAQAPRAYAFACECGRLGCAERVELSLADFEATPQVLAPAHS